LQWKSILNWNQIFHISIYVAKPVKCLGLKVSPIARNISLTFMAVLADVSMKRREFSSAYVLASSYSTILLLARSALLPARAITMLGDACLCSSFTQVLARPKVSWEGAG